MNINIYFLVFLFLYLIGTGTVKSGIFVTFFEVNHVFLKIS
jgi:hypothetical protein